MLEGIGWFIKGDKVVDDAVRQLEKDSDRAVGVLAASIVATRLSDAIQFLLKKTPQHEKPVNSLFGFNRPLYYFVPQINLAYLIGIISETAFSDLKIMADIRNDFAHKPEILDFQNSSVESRCLNMKLADQMVGEVSGKEIEAIQEKIKAATHDPAKLKAIRDDLGREKPYRFTGADQALKNTRSIYYDRSNFELLAWLA